MNLHLMGVTLLGPRVGARLLESWFLTTFPRYDPMGEEAKKPKHQLSVGRMSRVPGVMELHLALVCFIIVSCRATPTDHI
jgi:hypothetical protein